MPTLEKEAPPQDHAVDRPGFKRFMHEWEEKLHRQIDADLREGEKQGAPERKKAA